MPSSNPVLTERSLYDHLAATVFAKADGRAGDRVGVEVEFFPLLSAFLHTADAQPEREESDRFIGLYPWLRSLARRHGWSEASTESTAALAFDVPGEGRVTLEPGGQIEYSSPPLGSAAEALDDVEQFERVLTEEGESVGLILASEGFNRWLGTAEPKLVVEKPRYRIMDRHFERIGPFGRQMMRRTCATQINLDFGSSEKAERRWRAANMIAPALNALFANSPGTLDGVHYPSYRYEIWRRTDPCRAGSVIGMDGDPAEAYLRFAFDAPVMFVRGGDGRFLAPARPMTFRQWMNGEGEWSHGLPDMEDWAIHLTTLFPHVRPRGFMEIRSIDALPAPQRRAAVILTTELLYNDRLLDAMFSVADQSNRNGTVLTDGWEGRFAHGRRLLEIAIEETRSDELRNYRSRFTARRLTPAAFATERGSEAFSVPEVSETGESDDESLGA